MISPFLQDTKMYSKGNVSLLSAMCSSLFTDKASPNVVQKKSPTDLKSKLQFFSLKEFG